MHPTGPAVERATQAASRYINKQVSLLSTSDVRYNGELYTVDPGETSIALKHVDCLGTQDRRRGSDAISASDCTYEFIIFRAVNIKSLRLEEGDRHDLTREILEPLRQAAEEIKAQQKRSEAATKRRVGMDQSRNAEYGQNYDSRYTPNQQSQGPPPNQQVAPQGYYYSQSQGRSSSRVQYPVQGGNAPPPPRQYYDQRGAAVNGGYGANYGQYSQQPVSNQSGYYGGRPHSHSRSQAPQPPPQVNQGGQYGSSRAYYGNQGGYAPPPQQSSRTVRDGRSYYDQVVGYNTGRSGHSRSGGGGGAVGVAPNYPSNRNYGQYGYYPPRDSRGYQISPNYQNDPRRTYYSSRQYYNDGRGNYGGGYSRSSNSRGSNMGGGNSGYNRSGQGRSSNMRRGKYMQNQMGNTREAPGTGAFLQSKTEQEDPNDMNKLKDDFDFSNSSALFNTQVKSDEDDLKHDANGAAGGDVTVASNEQDKKDNGDNEDIVKTETTDDNANVSKNVFDQNNDDSDGLKEDKKDIDNTIEQLASMNLDIEPKYDKSKSFFDNLPQETRKDKKVESKEDQLLQQNIDAETFGSIAKNYQSKHMGYLPGRRYNYNRQNYNNSNNNMGFNKHRYNPRNQAPRNNNRRTGGFKAPRGYDSRGYATRQRKNRYRNNMNNDDSAQARWRKRD